MYGNSYNLENLQNSDIFWYVIPWKATIIFGFIEFNVPEVQSNDVTTAVATERAMKKFDYKSRRDTELFPRMIFYNRVGKCGSRSVLRLNGLQSADNTITGFNQLIANLWKERFIWFKIMKQLFLKEPRCIPLSMKAILFKKWTISASINRLFMPVICLSLILIKRISFLQCHGF